MSSASTGAVNSQNLALSPGEAARAAPSREPRKTSRRKTSHLKVVPETRALRDQLKLQCDEVAARLDRTRPLTKDEMESVARQLLEREGHPEGYLGWMMVMLSSAFYRDQVAATDPSRRLFLLPHCLKHAEGCPADYDEFGMNCKQCGACSIADFRTVAEEMGYKVLVAEGSARRAEDHCQRLRGRDRWRRLLECTGKGHRQDPAGWHSLHGRAAAVERLPQHERR